MIYQNLNLSLDELSYTTGFPSSKASHYTTISNIHEDIDGILAIANHALQSDIIASLERINVIILDLVKRYSIPGIEDICLTTIQHKELFQIIEITHNFLLPFVFQIIIQKNFTPHDYDLEIMPAIIAAETQINLLYQKILDGNTTQISAVYYEFEPFVFNVVEKEIKNTATVKAKKTKKSKLANFENNSVKTNKPQSPQDINLNWAK